MDNPKFIVTRLSEVVQKMGSIYGIFMQHQVDVIEILSLFLLMLMVVGHK